MRALGIRVLVLVSLTALVSVSAAQTPCPCEVPEAGPGTAVFVPQCADGYRGAWWIIDGLPGGTTINIDGRIHAISGVSEVPGGTLGGTASSFNALIEMELSGTGSLVGYYRLITFPTGVAEAHAAPRTLGTAVQPFPTTLHQFFGQILGDPDFDLLRITAGNNFGLPSPGHTTLTRLGPPGSDYQVDSFFDITWRIDFVGAPGGPLAGMSGSTVGVESRFELCEGTVPVQARTWGAIKSLY